MPNATHAIDPLHAYREGVRDTTNDRPIPLAVTAIDVTVEGVFATVRTRRVFRNDEAASIEATMTFPVPVEAVAHDLRVEIDGRTLLGRAEPKVQARETYEAALDAGKAAVLHEEALKGVHVLAIAHIPPGREVAVEICWSKPLDLHGVTPSLRIPTTVAEIYGRLPLLPADDLVVHETRVFEAELSVRADAGVARHLGRALEGGGPIRVPLDRPIDLAFTGLAPRELRGTAADGRRVALAIDPAGAAGDGPLRLGVLFDRSGSTGDAIDGDGGIDTWHAAMTGLRAALAGVARAADSYEIWQFDSIVEHVGAARGASVARVLDRIGRPRGGTEAGRALATATACADITDILFITDGRTGAIPVQAFAGCGKRVSAVLCGANSLDAMIGHLCALTGGQVIAAASDNIAAAIAAVLAAARAPADADAPRALAALPRDLSVVRGATAIRASWSAEPAGAAARDAVGAYAAALALPSMTEAAATQVAVAHGLCTHLTSLVVVDEAGEAQEGLPNQRKVPLSRPFEAAASAMPRARQAPYPAAAPAACPPPPAAYPVQAAPCAPPPAVYPEQVAPCAPPPESAAPRPLSPRPAAPAAGRGDREGGSFLRRLWPRPAATSPAAPRSLRHIAADIDWDGEAKALSKGVLAGVAAHDRAAVAAAARLARILEIAAEAGTTPQALVVALMAASVGPASRGAERIARQGLAGLSDARIAEAMALLGL